MVDEQEFWYGIDGERHGPVSRDELRALVASGRLGEGDWIWDEGREDWRPLHEYPDLLQGVQVPPPPPGGPHAPGDADFGDPAATRMAWEPRYGGFLLRLAAFVVDTLIMSLPWAAWGMYCQARTGVDLAAIQTDTLMLSEDAEIQAFRQLLAWGALLIFWAYSTALEASPWQATIGKRLMGLVVTDAEGRRPGPWQVALRRATWFLSQIMFWVPFILVAITRRKQGLHDMIARTLVLRR